MERLNGGFFFLSFLLVCLFLLLGAGETVDFDDADLEVDGRGQRRIGERQTALRLAVADVLVDPDRLSFSATATKQESSSQKKRLEGFEISSSYTLFTSIQYNTIYSIETGFKSTLHFRTGIFLSAVVGKGFVAIN